MISPADRLVYAAESLLFELEKQDVKSKTGKTAFEIVSELNKRKLPFLTHYSISKAVTRFVTEYKEG